MKHFLYILLFSILFLSFQAKGKISFSDFETKIQETMAHAQEGATEPQTFPFGSVRLLSCRSGIKDLRSLLTGLEVSLNPNWTLQSIQIRPESSSSYHTTVLPQFRLDTSLDESWTHHYKGYLIFPILLEDIVQKDTNFLLHTELSACDKDQCQIYNLDSVLSLPSRNAYPTAWCAVINNALRTAALPLSQTRATAKNSRLKNGDVRLRLTFPKKINVVQLQGPFSLISQTMNGSVFEAILHPDSPLQVGDLLPLNIRSSQGCYMHNLQIQEEPLLPLSKSPSLWILFWSGIFFFVSSPLWSLWLMPNTYTRSAKTLKDSIHHVQLWGLIGIVATFLFWNIQGTLLQSFFFIIPLFLLLLYLLKHPMVKGAMLAFLILILPKPFWDNISFLSIKSRIALLLWWGFFIYIPFNIWILFPKQVLKFFKTVSLIPAYQILVRLPYIILLTWLTLSLFCSPKDESFDPNSHVQPAIVRVVEPVCLACLKERVFFFSRLNQDAIKLYQTSNRSDWAQEIREKYQILRRSFNVLLREDGQEIILPENLSLYQLNLFL